MYEHMHDRFSQLKKSAHVHVYTHSSRDLKLGIFPLELSLMLRRLQPYTQEAEETCNISRVIISRVIISRVIISLM